MQLKTLLVMYSFSFFKYATSCELLYPVGIFPWNISICYFLSIPILITMVLDRAHITSYLDFWNNFLTVLSVFSFPMHLLLCHRFEKLNHRSDCVLLTAFLNHVQHKAYDVCFASDSFSILKYPSTTPAHRVRLHTTQGRSKQLPRMLLTCSHAVRNSHFISAKLQHPSPAMSLWI